MAMWSQAETVLRGWENASTLLAYELEGENQLINLLCPTGRPVSELRFGVYRINDIHLCHKTVYLFQVIKYIEDSMFTLLCVCLGIGIGSEF